MGKSQTPRVQGLPKSLGFNVLNLEFLSLVFNVYDLGFTIYLWVYNLPKDLDFTIYGLKFSVLLTLLTILKKSLLIIIYFKT